MAWYSSPGSQSLTTTASRDPIGHSLARLSVLHRLLITATMTMMPQYVCRYDVSGASWLFAHHCAYRKWSRHLFRWPNWIHQHCNRSVLNLLTGLDNKCSCSSLKIGVVKAFGSFVHCSSLPCWPAACPSRQSRPHFSSSMMSLAHNIKWREIEEGTNTVEDKTK